MTITGLQLGGLIAFAIITETVFQWPGMGLLFIQAVTFADIPVMAAYLCLIALIFVVINLIIRACALANQAATEPHPNPSSHLRNLELKTLFHQWWDGDVGYSFRTSPTAVFAALIALICLVCALFAPWIAPHNPFDLATLQLDNARLPPAWSVGGKSEYFLGTDDQGRDILSALMYGARISLAVGLASVVLSLFVGVSLGLLA
eukprot:gene34544-57336_t